MAAVELHEAYFWTCDGCGRDNFGRLVELEPEEIRELVPESLRADAAVSESMLGEGGGISFLMRPNQVKCHYCGARYRVEASE